MLARSCNDNRQESEGEKETKIHYINSMKLLMRQNLIRIIDSIQNLFIPL